jgi:hypothetical protein
MSRKSLPDFDTLVDKKAVADFLDVTAQTVAVWTQKQKIPSIRIGKKYVRYQLKDIAEALGSKYKVPAINRESWKREKVAKEVA